MSKHTAPIDPDELEQLTDKYSDVEIGEMYGCARVTVALVRKRYGIKSFTEKTGLRRRNGQVSLGGKPREKFFNENFFSEIDTEAKAYFLGLIAADGSITKDKTKLELSISEPDEHILYDFTRSIEADESMVKEKKVPPPRKRHYRIVLCSKTMATDLMSWGIVPNKTPGLKFEKKVPREVLHHFVRGYWDGDGSITGSLFSVGIMSPAFTEQFSEMIEELGGEKPEIRQVLTSAGNRFYELSVKRKRFERFRESLYKDASIFLRRKKEYFGAFWSREFSGASGQKT